MSENTLSITSTALYKAMLSWTNEFRAGNCKSAEECEVMTAEDLDRECTATVWAKLLQGQTP